MATRESSQPPTRRSRGRGIGVGAVLFALLACNHQLPRLNARGQHDEVVQRAASARY